MLCVCLFNRTTNRFHAIERLKLLSHAKQFVFFCTSLLQNSVISMLCIGFYTKRLSVRMSRYEIRFFLFRSAHNSYSLQVVWLRFRALRITDACKGTERIVHIGIPKSSSSSSPSSPSSLRPAASHAHPCE